MSDGIEAQGSFFQVGGTLVPGSKSYVTRVADGKLLRLTRAGEYCNVPAARQIGKSSLMMHTYQQLRREDIHTVVIDLDAIGIQGISANEWYFSFISEIRRQLQLEVDEEQWWEDREPLWPAQRFTEFLQDVVLQETSGQVVIFVDEIDSTLNQPFTDDFFAAIRSMFNERAANPDNKRLTFVLVGVAHPSDLIKDRMRRTPYNIGHTIELSDFTPREARTLLPGLEWEYAGRSERILQRVLYWTDGHPYLTQRVCAEIASRTESRWPNREIDRLVNELFLREGQLRGETNLQRVADYIQGSKHREEMLQVYREILSGKKVRDEEQSIVKSQLKLSGVVKATSAGYLRVRNRIYKRVFGPQWAGMPETPPEERPVRTRLPKLAVPALGAVLLIAIAVVGYNSLIGTPTPALSPTATSTEAIALVPTDTSTPLPRTPTETATREVVSTAERTKTPSHTPSPSPTTPTPQAASTPTTTPTSTPVPTSTPTATPSPVPTSTVTPVPIDPMPGAYSTAIKQAGIFRQPYADPNLLSAESNLLGGVQVGESVRVIGQAVEPWPNWLYIHRDRENLEGFVWAPFFEWNSLEIGNLLYAPFCASDGAKMAGFEIQMKGGNGYYTFLWEDQVVGVLEWKETESYFVSWPLGESSKVGTLQVASGDGQHVNATKDEIYLTEPSCSG